MNNAILIQHVWPDTTGVDLLNLTRERNEEYCRRWGFDFWPLVYANERIPYRDGNWTKIQLVLRAMDEGYKYIVWLDADALICDMETDLRDAILPGKIGACWHRIPQLDHWNVGVLYAHNADNVYEFCRDWLASYPAPPDGWMEQGVFNRMGRAGRTVVTLSDKWNATIDVNMVPDAVVLGFHGQGDAKRRLELMRQTLDQLTPEGVR